MKRYAIAAKLLALPLSIALVSSVSAAQGGLGSATVTGPVLVDGQIASGTVAVATATRFSTGDNASVSLKLAQGGEVMLGGQTDVVVTSTPAGPHVQLVCGEVTVTSTVPATIVSRDGARVFSKDGRAVVMDAGKSTTVKEGKTKDFNDPISVAVTGAGTSTVVTSRVKCNCNCH
jgi:hypothetical protein